MTLSVPTPPAPVRPQETRAGQPAQRHAGCYWDHERAAWVAYTAVPTPRPAQG